MKLEKETLKLKRQVAFNALIGLLVHEFAPLYIYQFAKKVNQEKLNSVFWNGEDQWKCTYYLLMITGGSMALEHQAQEFVNRNCLELKVIIHVHGHETLLRNINHCNGYFARVINEGKLHYVAPGVDCLKPLQMPNIKKRLSRAIVHWRKRKEMADGFFMAATQAAESGHEQVSLFLLHHATEQACVGLIYVFMDYQSDIRNLERLLYVCACFSNRPFQHFLGTADNEMLLKIMMKGFSQARYDQGFSIGNHSIYRFLDLVESFLKLAITLCEAQFNIMKIEVDQIKTLKGVTKND